MIPENTKSFALFTINSAKPLFNQLTKSFKYSKIYFNRILIKDGLKMNRKTARENAFLLLFESIFRSEDTAEEILDMAKSVRSLEVDEYVSRVFFGAYQNAAVIDALIEKNLVGWKAERISPVSRAILRLATYEMMFEDDIPGKVSINEGIELAKKYDDEKTYGFVNGVLNAVAEALSRK